MGVKLPPGTHTFTPTSPQGDSRLGTVSEDGNHLGIDGLDYVWNGTLGRYQSRNPPPPADPPGEWHWYDCDNAENWDRYETHALPPHNVHHVERGTVYANG